ncbi:MAG TPA: DUF2339 domain-containing protein [Gaiellaceae bacterium]|nr:DUF2339 domain-containing protein [Gaiellaceae bacterium]
MEHESAVEERLTRVERRLHEVELELLELRGAAAAAPSGWQRVRPPVEERAPAAPTTPPPPVPPQPPLDRSAWEAVPPVRSMFSDRDLTVGDLLGARALAWAGGVVTLLGIVLLFVLAVNRGWIGPVARVGIGAVVSAIVFGGGLWLQRRYGQTYSALAAVGAGIAGAYATLLAAAALYDLLPALVALGIAGGIAAVGVATSLFWGSEIVAGIGLIGAMLVPVAVVFDGGLTVLGTGFVALMLAAAGVVGVVRRWPALLVCAAAASLPQIADVVAEADPRSARASVLGAAFALLYAAIGIALQRRRRGPQLDGFPASFVLGGAVVGGGTALLLYEGHAEGLALLAAAAPFALAAAYFFPQSRDRELSALLAALALALGAVAVSDLLSGPTLAVAWAAEAAVLCWLADRTREPRFQLTAFAYFALAVVHAIGFDAPPVQWATASMSPGHGVLGAVAAALSAAVIAHFTRGAHRLEAHGVFARLDGVFANLAQEQQKVRVAFASTAGLLAMYAASLGLLHAFVRLMPHVAHSFEWGHVAVTGMFAAVGVVVLVAGLRRGSRPTELAAVAWLGLALMIHAVYDLDKLNWEPRSYASLEVAAAALAVAVVYQLLKPELTRLSAITVVAALTSPLLGCLAVLVLVGRDLGGRPEGVALLTLALVYGFAAVAVYRRQRDLSTLLWSIALVVWAGASLDLVHGTWRVLAWAAAAVALAGIARQIVDERLILAALALLGLALGHTLVLEAPPTDLFVSSRHPGEGIPALVCVAGALAALVGLARSLEFTELRALRSLSRHAAWTVGALVVFAASLGILEAAEAIGMAGVVRDFQHGQSVVSAFWGVLGLVALYAGLRRRRRTLRYGGFALFGFSLAKLFLYDLAALSSITRALSFLAVGAVLLLGGFFYQRLSAELEERPAA